LIAHHLHSLPSESPGDHQLPQPTRKFICRLPDTSSAPAIVLLDRGLSTAAGWRLGGGGRPGCMGMASSLAVASCCHVIFRFLGHIACCSSQTLSNIQINMSAFEWKKRNESSAAEALRRLLPGCRYEPERTTPAGSECWRCNSMWPSRLLDTWRVPGPCQAARGERYLLAGGARSLAPLSSSILTTKIRRHLIAISSAFCAALFFPSPSPSPHSPSPRVVWPL
jgi:hypothetical protein